MKHVMSEVRKKDEDETNKYNKREDVNTNETNEWKWATQIEPRTWNVGHVLA